jgi:GH18 family chitinase
LKILIKLFPDGIEDFLKLKYKNPSAKFLISIGGSTEESYNFNRVISDESLKVNLLKSLKDFIKRFKFDGFDLYIDGPADKDKFTEFLRDIREFITELGILTVVIAHETLETYDIKKINRYLDYYILKAYDYHAPEDGYLGYNAPLSSGPSDDSNYLKLLNIASYL